MEQESHTLFGTSFRCISRTKKKLVWKHCLFPVRSMKSFLLKVIFACQKYLSWSWAREIVITEVRKKKIEIALWCHELKLCTHIIPNSEENVRAFQSRLVSQTDKNSNLHYCKKKIYGDLGYFCKPTCTKTILK